MTKVLILGANGRIARIVEQRLLAETDVQLTLVLRNAGRLLVTSPERETVIQGDVSDSQLLDTVMPNQDIVYANLAGNMALLAQTIITSIMCPILFGSQDPDSTTKPLIHLALGSNR